jgi:hypothetical protein
MWEQRTSHEERQARKAAAAAEADREAIRRERADVRRWTAEAAMERARRERAGQE